MTKEAAPVKEETKRILNRFSRRKANLIPILQKVQGKLGYLPQEAMLEIAQFLDIPPINVYSVVTFYNQFRLNPPGRHSIKVCLGTACHMKGGYITLDAWKRRLNIDIKHVTELFIIKCRDKGIEPPGPDMFFPKDLPEILSPYWERELGRLVHPVPDIKTILKELKTTLADTISSSSQA